MTASPARQRADRYAALAPAGATVEVTEETSDYLDLAQVVITGRLDTIMVTISNRRGAGRTSARAATWLTGGKSRPVAVRDITYHIRTLYVGTPAATPQPATPQPETPQPETERPVNDNPAAEIGDTEVVAAMTGNLAAALAAGALHVVDAEVVDAGAVLLGFLNNDPGEDRPGMELLMQPMTIGTVGDDELGATGVYALVQDPREGYDVIRVQATQKLLVRRVTR